LKETQKCLTRPPHLAEDISNPPKAFFMLVVSRYKSLQYTKQLKLNYYSGDFLDKILQHLIRNQNDRNVTNLNLNVVEHKTSTTQDINQFKSCLCHSLRILRGKYIKAS